ncbi:T-complex protein 11-like protein 1 [Tribolium castaneum]|uniref:T-complex protein 11-like protein 1 n=1 Tax=Tribolium castaneum TaxID=7070 RepID=D2A0W6_TRICA|nr:PREDICTED: T-complex protein 11-like protein 1 [Tribolium castaneum]XP_015834680.1 PREDICTED: T-complex protein 11-like protein 1 [Tribolium castaneum]XP_972749.1 PREDICTED: T-complex protein 11-like protein 1 [Tribolium castaneum]EFA01622.1 T-complex protein 11-like protein 1 [Tribolium castaneum]|eukprot:XP_008192575.1 PREDICTED: T-complex protein 11-like protein 1 [Tribolium castaneum]
MSSDDKKLGASDPKDTGTGPRIRTQSECSVTSDDGAQSSSGKRQRTTSAQFMVSSGLTSASPPKFVSLEEIMQAANGMRDMALVHQIVVDDDFKLQKVEPEPNTLHKMVNDTMRKAFWDLLRNELAEDPPNYTQALVLLEDIKKGLFAVLLPQHTKIKQQISEILDSELIKQQAENGALDFGHYAHYVISVMAKLCAPVRDEKIKELTQTTDVIDTFKGILETLDLMKLDMANFTLQMVRPDIIAHSVELERKKFADFLAVQSDGLERTKKWLLKHVDTSEVPPANSASYDSFVKTAVKKASWDAFIDLMDWDENEPYPETFLIDEARLRDLQVKTNRLTAIGTILLVTLSHAGPDLQSIAEFKASLKDHISILLQSIQNDKDLKQVLPNVAEQVICDVKEAQKKYNFSGMNDVSETVLRQQIEQISNEEHKIRSLVRQRIKEFFMDIIESSTAAPQKVPTGLSSLQRELAAIAGQFLRIVSHNNTVFCIYYYDIVAAALPKPA